MSSINNDLFNNPMIDSARKALTDEQVEEYKRIGEYMYNSVDYKNISMGSQVKEASDEDFLFYAVQALRSGGDPHDLTKQELEMLNKIYGEKWYERFDLEENEVPKLKAMVITPEDIIAAAEKKVDSLNLTPIQKRRLRKRIAKDKRSFDKKR